MRRGGVLACVLALGGCAGDPVPTLSADLATGALVLHATLDSNGHTALVQASAETADYHGVTLSGADRLLLASPDAEVALVALQGGYPGQLDTTSTDLSLLLERAGGARFAIGLPLPPPFAVVAPSPPVSLAAPFTLTWNADPGDFQTLLDVTSDCFAGVTRTLATDPGAYTLQPADLAITPGLTSCTVAVEVTRKRQGGHAAPELLDAGPFTTTQTRSLDFPANP
jgi:hypothetical protein